MQLDLFLPKLKFVNEIGTSSVPYKCKDGRDIFLADVIEVSIIDDLSQKEIKENYAVTISEGIVIGCSYSKDIYVELNGLPSDQIKNLGSSLENPELLELI